MTISNLRFVYKIMLLVAVMAVTTGAVGTVGYVSLKHLGAAGRRIDDADSHAIQATQLNQSVTALNRAEYSLAVNPSQANADQAKDVVGKIKQEIERETAELHEGATPEEKSLLATVQNDYKAYLAELDDTFVKVKANGSAVKQEEARRIIAESVESSRVAADRLNGSMSALANHFDDKGAKEAEAGEAMAANASVTMIAGSVGGVILGIMIGFCIGTFGISGPVARTVASLRRLAEGDADSTIFGTGRGDEIGDIANTMQVFKDNILRNRQMERAAKEAEIRAAEEKKRAMNDLADGFEASVKGIVGTVSSSATQLQSTATGMTSIAQQTSRQATVVAAASEQASANVQTVATAADELSASIGEISRQVAHAAMVSAEAVGQTEHTNELIARLVSAADKIGAVVNLINDIAGQTNLLALNATIEAARAGDSGKGFAVVAGEVKTLASQTAKATEEIKAQVSEVQISTRGAVDAIAGISRTIASISDISASIASAVEEQGAATREIARNVEQAAVGTEEVTRNISGVTHASHEAHESASHVLHASGDLARSSEALRGAVEGFIGRVRAA